MKEKINQSVCHIDIYSMRERERSGEKMEKGENDKIAVYEILEKG